MTLMLIFSVDGTRFALPIADVESIVRMVRMELPPPGRKAAFGTFTFHGSILPVYSIRRLFGSADRTATTTDVLIIVRLAGESIAFWADETSGVHDIPIHSETKKTEPGGTSPAGTFKAEDGTIVILDPSVMLGGCPGIETQDGEPDGPQTRTGEVPGRHDRDGSELTGDLARIQILLDERAEDLARPQNTVAGKVFEEFLGFRLMYQEYAIGMQYVREVILTGEITPVPGTPDFIAGICAIRGEIISLVDLRGLFSLAEKGLTDLNRVIVITDGMLTFGILADHITGVGRIDMDALSTELADLPFDRKYLRGISESSVIILDAGALLSDPDLIVDEKDG